MKTGGEMSEMFKTVCCSLFVLLVVFQNVGAANNEFYRKLSNRKDGSCQIYNGTECSEFLTGKRVFVEPGTSILEIEKKLKKWFKQNKKSGQISRECWPHAAALTCMHFYPQCDANTNRAVKTFVCSEHCRFLTKHMCKGEYKRVRASEYFRKYLPLCDEVSLIQDPTGKFCFFLPTINLKEGPIPIAEKSKKIRVPAGKSAHLQCFFTINNFYWTKTRKQMITEGTWYKNSRRIMATKTVSIRTKSKGKARLHMVLKIRHATRKDEGNYRCVISFAGKTVYSSATLIVSDVVPVVKQIIKPKGGCKKYRSGICAPYFKEDAGNNIVYEDSNYQMDLVNGQLQVFIQNLKKFKQLSKKCETFGQAVLCYNKFQKCDKNSKKVASLCKQDCELFHTEYCKSELDFVRNEKTIMALFIPQCNLLNDTNPECIPISKGTSETLLIKNSVHPKFSEMHCYDEDSGRNYLGKVSMTRSGKFCDLWKNYRGYKHIPHDYCRNFGENKPWCFVNRRKEYCSIKPCEPTCYENEGEEYYGTIAVSQSGKKCLPWKIKFIHTNIDHAYCRNFDGETAPYCYVNANTKELCDIPKCVSKDKAAMSTISLVVYIVPTVIGATALLFSLFLLAFYMKNNKLLRVTKAKVARSKEFVLPATDSIDTPMVNTLSTTASLDLHKEQIDLEKISLLSTPPQIEIIDTKNNKQSDTIPEIKEARLLNMTKIGDGRLAQIFQGEYIQNRDKRIPIVVQKLRPDTKSAIVSEFRLEMNMLRGLKHKNLQRVVCVSAMSEIPFIAFECKVLIDLKEHLKGDNRIHQDFYTKILYQVASGLDYLHKHQVMHKDVAARNCFVSANGNIRISKCQLSRCRYPIDYVNLPTLGRSPVRWLPPETLELFEYRPSTDIYMFGVLIWEIFSKGSQPYADFTDEEVIDKILSGVQLETPDCCPSNFQNIMEQCWNVTMCQRPQFSWIKDQLAIRTPSLLRHTHCKEDGEKTF